MAIARGYQDRLAPGGLLNVRAARLAGVLSLLMAALAAAAVAYYLFAVKTDSPVWKSLAGAKLVFLGIVGAAAVQLILGRAWAQRFLLVVWLAGLIGVVALTVAGVFWGTPTWWTFGLPMAQVLIPMAAAEMFAVGALAVSSAPGSRLRYSTNVSLAIAAAVAVVVVANMFAQNAYARIDVETLGRFSVSQRTKKILQTVDKSVRITCVYSDQTDEDKAENRRDRTMDLLREMKEQNKLLEIDNVTTDSQKAALVARLREKLARQAPLYNKLLADFLSQSGDIVQGLAQQQSAWEGISGQGYLDQWGLASEVARIMKQGGQQFEKVRDKVKAALAEEGLPDYKQLVDELKAELQNAADTTKAITENMKKVAAIPPAVKANRDEAMRKADEADKAVAAMAQVLGPEGQEPSDPAGVLRKFVEATDAASKRLQEATVAVKGIAGQANAPIVEASQAWLAKSGGRKVMTSNGVVLQERRTITDLYSDAAAAVTKLKMEVNVLLEAANAAHQAKTIADLRQTVASIQSMLADIRKEAAGAIKTLSDVDEPTSAMLDQAADGKAFERIMTPAGKLLEQAAALPALEPNTFSAEITGKNIVILETDDKTQVIDFESVWPLKVQQTGMAEPEGSQKRTFNGDSAVSSKMLSTTHEPFATVLITYYKPEIAREMERMLADSGIFPENLSTLTSRLKEANFKVEQWNLRENRPKPEAGRPQVLLVPPPPEIPPMSTPGQPKLEPFGPQHLDKLKAAIDEGTPAIFLARWEQPRQTVYFIPPSSPPYQLGDYLRKEWGMEVVTDMLVLPAVPDRELPRKLRLDMKRMYYFPISSFSDHVIGRPLQGQRMLWRWPAIVRKANAIPAGVIIEPLLTMDETYRNVWATKRLEEIGLQIQGEEGSYISPDYGAGDLPVPFDLAAVATRAGSDQAKPARIVVLGLAAGLMDGFLNQREPVQEVDGGISLSDPPRADADVVTNSVYWLIGREGYIASGPTKAKPLAAIGPGLLKAIQWSSIVGLPALVLVAGGFVLFVRRR